VFRDVSFDYQPGYKFDPLAAAGIDGGFGSATNWTAPGVWTISGGVASTGLGAANNLYTSVSPLAVGHLYRLTYTIVTLDSGTYRIYCGGSAPGTVRNAVGTYSEIIRCVGDGIVYVVNGNNTVGSIDNIIIEPLESVVYSLPSWLAHSYSGAGITYALYSQIAADRVISGLSGPRSRNVGAGFGLAIEATRTNLCTQSSTFNGAAWSVVAGGSSTNDSTAAPTLAVTADTLTYTATADSGKRQIGMPTTPHNQSLHIKKATGSKITIEETTGASETSYVPLTTWRRVDRNCTPSGAGIIRVGGTSTGEAGDCYVWGAQVEAALYPSSHIQTIAAAVQRAAEKLTISDLAGCIMNGYYDLGLKFAPHYASTEYASNHTLWYADATNQAYIRAADDVFVFVCGGVTIESAAQTWAREAQFDVRLRRTPTACELVVNGVASSGAVQAAWSSPPATATLLSGASGAEECASLIRFDCRVPV
jgi:hypothetical protein